MKMPAKLFAAIKPVTVVVGHYGAGKTNFSVNMAIDLAAGGARVTLIDLDVINPYFRATEQRAMLEVGCSKSYRANSADDSRCS